MVLADRALDKVIKDKTLSYESAKALNLSSGIKKGFLTRNLPKKFGGAGQF